MAKRPYEIPEGSLEKVVKDKVKKFFNDNDIWYIMPTPSPLGAMKGMSDFQALHKSVFIAVETKANRTSAKASEHQLNYLAKVNACGGIGVVVKCEADILQLEQTLIANGLLT